MRKILLFFLIINSAFAQSNTSTYELDSIELQGTKEKKTLKQTNSSVFIIKENSKTSPVIENSLETLNAISNITINKEEESFTIRGVKNTGVTGYQKDNLSSIIIDNVFQTDLALKAGSLNFFDLNSMEIFRGAQSTTQGVNSLAGSINLYHHRANRTDENILHTEIGDYGKLNLDLASSGDIIKNRLSTRVSGTYLNNDGHVTNKMTDNKSWGKKTNYNFNVDFTAKIDDSQVINWTNKIFKSETGGNYVHGPNPYDYVVRENQDSKIKTNNAQTGLEYINTINENFSNSLQLSYSNSKQTTNTDSDLSELDKTGSRIDYHRDNFLSIENVLNFKSERISNTTGIHVHRFSLIDNYNFNVIWNNKSPVTLNIRQYVDRKRETYAIYDSLSFKTLPDQYLNLGLRFENVQNKYLTNVAGNRNGVTGNSMTDKYLDKYIADRSGAYGGDHANNKLLPKIGYTLNSGIHTFGVNISEGYRTGGVSINRYRTTAVNYDPESTLNYELSHKAQINDLKISNNLFFTQWKNQQVQIALSSDAYDTQVENASSSQYFGGEMDLSYSISENHEISSSLGFVKTRYNSFQKDKNNYQGNQFPNAPLWTSILAHSVGIFKNINLKTTLRYLGTSFADPENQKRIPEQFYADMGIQYNFESISAELKIKNILDNKYVINSFSNLYGNYYQMSTPREISLGLTSIW